MQAYVERMVSDFERGRLSRRDLIGRLSLLTALAGGGGRLLSAESEPIEEPAPAADAATTFQATELNHIALRVTDVARSRDWYLKHLGLTVSREGANNAFLNCGQNFLALFQGDAGRMDHYCYSVKNYDAAAAEDRLRTAGLPGIRRTGDRVYFSDPDGLTVQVAAESHLP